MDQAWRHQAPAGYAVARLVCWSFSSQCAALHNVLSLPSGTPCPHTGLQGSYGQRSCGGLLPFPVLLPVSLRYMQQSCHTRSSHTQIMVDRSVGLLQHRDSKRLSCLLAVCRHLVSMVDGWAPHWLPACLWYSFLMQMLCTSSHVFQVRSSRLRRIEETTVMDIFCVRDKLNGRAVMCCTLPLSLQHSLSSHVVPALRALLPVAFLCEVSSTRAALSHAEALSRGFRP